VKSVNSDIQKKLTCRPIHMIPGESTSHPADLAVLPTFAFLSVLLRAMWHSYVFRLHLVGSQQHCVTTDIDRYRQTTIDRLEFLSELMSQSTHSASIAFPANQLHWYWQPKQWNKTETRVKSRIQYRQLSVDVTLIARQVFPATSTTLPARPDWLGYYTAC